MLHATITPQRKKLFLKYSLKSYRVHIWCHASVVHGCGMSVTLTLSGIVLNDVLIV
jgi:hypothetical protein